MRISIWGFIVEGLVNVLVIGCGGREHAIVRYLRKSPICGKLFSYPGSDAINLIATPLRVEDYDSYNFFSKIVKSCKDSDIGLVVIGPETYLADGLADELMDDNILVFGPSKAASRLESSKVFTKELCSKFGIPTANYSFFVDEKSAKKYLKSVKYPVVVKNDGLASGKGSRICYNFQEACDFVDLILIEKKFDRDKSESVVLIEDFLEGEEISFFTLVDGSNTVVFGVAKDYKTIGENNKGSNTGGMGSYSSSNIISHGMQCKIIREIINPTISAINSFGVFFRGILFAGIIITKSGPKLLEYNVRFGDPETQCILPRLDCDLLELLLLTAKGKLGSRVVKLDESKFAMCVVVASRGYPGEYKKGSVIKGIPEVESCSGVQVFHAGTKLDFEGNILSNSGRVLNIVSEDYSLEKARHKAYAALDLLDWSGGVYRYDIGSSY